MTRPRGVTYIFALWLSLQPFTVAIASEGKLTFTGTLLAESCDATLDGSSASGIEDLGTYPVSRFATSGSESPKFVFHILLKNCPPAVTNATIAFNGIVDENDETAFKNNDSGEGAARGFGFRLYNNGASSEIIKPNSASQTVSIINGLADFSFSADITRVSSQVTAGTLKSAVDYTINYQ